MTRKPPDTIASRLRIAREAAGLSLTALASLAGLSRQLLTKIEAGEQKSPRFNDVAKIAKVLRLSLGDFDGLET